MAPGDFNLTGYDYIYTASDNVAFSSLTYAFHLLTMSWNYAARCRRVVAVIACASAAVRVRTITIRVFVTGSIIVVWNDLESSQQVTNLARNRTTS